MRPELESIGSGFECLKRLRNGVVETIDAVDQRVGTLKKEHEDLVASSPLSACALGLDSLHFQVRLVTMELRSLREMVIAVENHLYYECLYLHKSIQSYARSEIKDMAAKERVVVEREYPPYKHLDKSARYDFDVTVGLHVQLVASIQAISDYCDEQAFIVESEKGKTAQGLNIDSLVHSNAYVHALLRAKTDLFLRSLGAFNVHHSKYMRRIQDKASLVLEAISREVKLVPQGGALEAGEDEQPIREDGTHGQISSRLTEAQRARKRRKQKKMRAKQQERLRRSVDEGCDADSTEAGSDADPEPPATELIASSTSDGTTS